MSYDTLTWKPCSSTVDDVNLWMPSKQSVLAGFVRPSDGGWQAVIRSTPGMACVSAHPTLEEAKAVVWDAACLRLALEA